MGERNIMMERESIQRDDVPGLEDFLARQKKTLAPSHANMLDVKKQLSVAYGRYPGYEIKTLSMDKLKKKISYCHEVIDALEILEPGLSTQKGLTLYELWYGESELANRLLAEGKLDKETHRQRLRTAFESLEESAKILRYEPENSLQGKVSLEVDSKLEAQRLQLAVI